MSREERLRLKRIYTNSGIDYRYSVLKEFGEKDAGNHLLFHPDNHHPSLPVSERMELFVKYSRQLVIEAAHDALKDSGYSSGEITHIITFSCTGLFAPGPDIILAESLELNKSVERTCINFMGCFAGINALKTANHIVRSQPDAVVLLCGIELCTLHYQRSFAPQQIVANALFGDGAAACVVSGQKGKSTVMSMKSFYSEFEPSGKKDMVWTIGDSGFNLWLSADIPDLISKSIAAFFQRLLKKAEMTRDEISYYAIHPGGLKILQAVENAVGLTKSENAVSYDILKRFGNMSSVTTFFILKEYMMKLTEKDRGKKILACAFGPGLTMESMLAEVC